MAETLGHYAFIPWIRQGVASRIREVDTLGSGDGAAIERAGIDVSIVLQTTNIEDGSADEHPTAKQVRIYGPGDITGISPRAILRTEPVANVNNFEANLLPYIEFYEEDFPWRYTPARPAESGVAARRLRPWIALIVLKEDEFTLTPNPKGLASIKIAAEKINAALYSHTDLWAWAHVHLNEDLDNTSDGALAGEVSGKLDADPDLGISRLLCPRKLQKNTPYTAFLIPSFETGRLTGLGEPTAGVPAQKPAWTKTGSTVATEATRQNEFPVYYHWKFATGELGDFESLVSALKPVITKPETGKLPMDIQDPGFHWGAGAEEDQLNSETIGFEGALKPPEFSPDVFPKGPLDENFQEKLKEILNLAVEIATGNESTGNSQAEGAPNPFYQAPFVEDPIIVPPIYGYWHAMIQKLGTTSNPAWIEQINLDPRMRGAAGLGTITIQKNQEDLMNRAWQQVGKVNEANQKIKEAQLSKMVMSGIFKKHLVNAPGSRFTELTSAMHSKVLDTGATKTINQAFRESRVPLAAKSAAFKRMVRPEKKINQRINAFADATAKIHQQVLRNFNKDESIGITTATVKQSPANALTFSDLQTLSNQLLTEYQENDQYLVKDLLFAVLQELDLNNLDRPLLKQAVNNSDFATAVKTKANQVVDAITTYNKSGGIITVEIPIAEYEDIFATGVTDTPSSKRYNNVIINRPLKPNEAERTGKATTLVDIQAYGNSFQTLLGVTQQPQYAIPVMPAALEDIDGMFTYLKGRLHPALNLDQKIRKRIKILKDGVPTPIEAVKPIMAHPKFEEPVYEQVKQISQDFILPNVELLPENSVTLLQTNQRFIESYMTGLNHEMSRELLWREYPTDQRGSYFRQFWDVKDNLFEEDQEKKLDIQAIHEWRNGLGDHTMQTPGGGYLVLVVRGQLLLKYPNTLVYAQRASYDPADPTGERLLPATTTPENTRFPSFSASLEPDIFLFGFALTMAEAEGERVELPTADTSGMNPGWFFVFKERPGQIKFGLDDYIDELGNTNVPLADIPAPETWNDLTWEHLVDDRADLQSYQLNFGKTINITSPPASQPNPGWGDNAADLAFILYQNPVIFARHAQEMLKED